MHAFDSFTIILSKESWNFILRFVPSFSISIKLIYSIRLLDFFCVILSESACNADCQCKFTLFSVWIAIFACLLFFSGTYGRRLPSWSLFTPFFWCWKLKIRFNAICEFSRSEVNIGKIAVNTKFREYWLRIMSYNIQLIMMNEIFISRKFHGKIEIQLLLQTNLHGWK